jgi:hypothetical protein
MSMDLLVFIFLAMLAIFGVYLVSRLIFAAYFKAKQQYEAQRYGQRSQLPGSGS